MAILYFTSTGERISDETIKRRYAQSRAEKYLYGQSKICEGCGGEAVCSAHIIAQARLKHLHKSELIYNPDAYFPACYACNQAIENPKGTAWRQLKNIEICLEFIEKHDHELFMKFIL